MLQRAIVSIAILMALAVLGFLVFKTQAPPQDLNLHLEHISKVSRLQQLNAEFDREIARARLALDTEPQALFDAQKKYQAETTSFSETSYSLSAVGASVNGALNDYFQAARQKEQLLQEYPAQIKDFSSKFQAMRDQGDDVLSALSVSERGNTRKQVMELMVEATTYCIQAAPTNGTGLENLTLSLANSVDNSDSALRDKLRRLALSVQAVRTAKDNLQSKSESLLAIPVASSLQRLLDEYYVYYSTQESSISRFRLLLAIYATALLLVFGLVGWRLRYSYGALDKSNAQLQDINAHLEESVQTRTQELSKALSDLRLQQAQLVQSEKMASLGQMVAGVAHEINTPLGYARSNVETLRESNAGLRTLIESYEKAIKNPGSNKEELEESRRVWNPDEGLEEMDMLLGDAEHGLGQISELVMSLKDFSRVDRSMTELFDLNDGLDMALKICQNQFKHRIEISKEYAELPRIPCAPSQLNQVFLNIINNAAQAIDGEGLIRLQTRETEDAVEVSIIDTGCGMDAQTQAHIFEPFFTTKDVGQGTGLGLSIVFKIIEDHRGTIRVQSTLGEGTEFLITLPKRAVKAAAAKVESAVDAQAESTAA